MSATVNSARSRGWRSLSVLLSAVGQGDEPSPPQVAGDGIFTEVFRMGRITETRHTPWWRLLTVAPTDGY